MTTARLALVLGGGGALGSVVLEQLLARELWRGVGVVAAAQFQPALRGLQAVQPDAIARFGADTALIVFDRHRHANGREAAFVRPEPAALPALASQLHEAGVKRLIVVVPHTPALLPQALLVGLATLDETAVAAMGFEHLVFMRMAQAGGSGAGAGALPQGWGHRLARGLLAQLHWLVPQREQPVRHSAVARTVAALAQALPDASQGVRVLPPQVCWLVAQGADAQEVVASWLAGRPLPQMAGLRQRW